MVYYFTLRLYNRLHSMWRHDGLVNITRPASPSDISYNKIRFQVSQTPAKTASKLQAPSKKSQTLLASEATKMMAANQQPGSLQSKLLLFDGINRSKGFGDNGNVPNVQTFVR